MLSWFNKKAPGRAATAPLRTVPLPDLSAYFLQSDGFCHPDWEAISIAIEKSVVAPDHASAWRQAARLWLDQLCLILGSGYRIDETSHFLILSEAPKRVIDESRSFFEKALQIILNSFKGVALDHNLRKHVVLMFSNKDDYYSYIMHFYPDGEHPMSGGVCLSGGGYVHFAFPAANYESYREVLVHELTHACISHLPLPRWLDEAMAMRMEESIARSLHPPLDRELFRKHCRHWNAHSIQLFWSGKSWKIQGDSFDLSYDLTRILWRKIEVDLRASHGSILSFLAAASYKDAGESACQTFFDIGLADLMGDFMGEGDWAPKPETWPKLPLN